MSRIHYVNPRDRVMSEVLREMQSLSLPDLVTLRDNAQHLNRARLEQEARMRQVYPLYHDTSHAE